MSRPALVALAALALAAALSGCTLLKDEEPFVVRVASERTEPTQVTVAVEEADGGEVFRTSLSVSRTTLRTPYHLPELDGDFRFSVEADGQRWEDAKSVTPGKSSWTVLLKADGSVCFQYLDDGDSDAVCPEEG